MDAAPAALKRKGRDSPAAVEIAAEKRKHRDSPAAVEIDAATSAVEIDATTSAVEINAATSAVEIDAATSAVEIDAATSAVEIDAATSAVEIDAATAAAGINASTIVFEIDAAIAGAKNRAATARQLAIAKEQAVRNAKLYSEFAHPVVETAATNDARLVALPEYVKLMADYKETQHWNRYNAHSTMLLIAKRPNLAKMADELNDLRLRQAHKAETRRASTRVTGLVRNLYAVVSNGNFGAMTWKTDDTFVIASESSLKKVISNGHFGDLAYSENLNNMVL